MISSFASSLAISKIRFFSSVERSEERRVGKEKKRIFEIAKDEAKDDITLIAQVGSINLKESVELAKFVT